MRVDEKSTLVRLEADFSVLRRTMVGQTSAGAVVGGASSVFLVVMGVIAREKDRSVIATPRLVRWNSMECQLFVRQIGQC